MKGKIIELKKFFEGLLMKYTKYIHGSKLGWTRSQIFGNWKIKQLKVGSKN